MATVETTSGRPDMNVLDFDKDSDEHAQFSVAFPKSWNAGTVTFQFFWSGHLEMMNFVILEFLEMCPIVMMTWLETVDFTVLNYFSL